MRPEQSIQLDSRTQKAVEELQGAIAQKYPATSFALSHPEDEPTSIEITAVVDVDDPDEVLQLVIDRVVEMQVEENIPIHVVPIRTPERVLDSIKAQHARRRPRRTHSIPRLSRPPLTQR
jgi:hypothetical protein